MRYIKKEMGGCMRGCVQYKYKMLKFNKACILLGL